MCMYMCMDINMNAHTHIDIDIAELYLRIPGIDPIRLRSVLHLSSIGIPDLPIITSSVYALNPSIEGDEYSNFLHSTRCILYNFVPYIVVVRVLGTQSRALYAKGHVPHASMLHGVPYVLHYILNTTHCMIYSTL